MGALEREGLGGERDKKARIIIIGSELLKGIVRDVNLYFISGELTRLGFYVDRAIFLHDNLEDIVVELTLAINTVDVVIVTGGLGPTQDDLTRYAISRAFNIPLIISQKALEKLEKTFEDEEEFKKRIKMCYIPKDAVILDNDVGVAPGFYLKVDSTHVFVLPGVPREAKEMFVNHVSPMLQKLFNLEKMESISVKFFNMKEKDLEDIILDVLKRSDMDLYYKILIRNDHLVLNVFVRSGLVSSVKHIINNIVNEVKAKYPMAEYIFDDGAGGGI